MLLSTGLSLILFDRSKVRLPYLPWGKPVQANWRNSEVRPDQYGRLYALIHWCKDVDHQALHEVDIKDIATSRIFSGKVTRGNAIIGGLQDVDNERSKLVNQMLTFHPNITTFFARIAFGYHKDFLKQQAARTNQVFREPPYYEPPLVFLSSIGLVEDMLITPIGLLKTVSKRLLQPWQH